MPQPDHIATVGIAAFIKDDALPEAASKDLRGISPMRPKPRRTSSGSEFNQITNVVQARMVALRCTIWSPSPVRLDMADARSAGMSFAAGRFRTVRFIAIAAAGEAPPRSLSEDLRQACPIRLKRRNSEISGTCRRPLAPDPCRFSVIAPTRILDETGLRDLRILLISRGALSSVPAGQWRRHMLLRQSE